MSDYILLTESLWQMPKHISLRASVVWVQRILFENIWIYSTRQVNMTWNCHEISLLLWFRSLFSNISIKIKTWRLCAYECTNVSNKADLPTSKTTTYWLLTHGTKRVAHWQLLLSGNRKYCHFSKQDNGSLRDKLLTAAKQSLTRTQRRLQSFVITQAF